MHKTAIAFATTAALALASGPLAATATTTTTVGSVNNTESTIGQSGSNVGDTSMDRERTADLQQIFEQLDQDGDGQLDQEELSSYGTTAAGQSTSGMEAGDRGERLMEQLDADRDGYVDEEELQQGHTPARQKGQSGYDPEAGAAGQ